MRHRVRQLVVEQGGHQAVYQAVDEAEHHVLLRDAERHERGNSRWRDVRLGDPNLRSTNDVPQIAAPPTITTGSSSRSVGQNVSRRKPMSRQCSSARRCEYASIAISEIPNGASKPLEICRPNHRNTPIAATTMVTRRCRARRRV